MTLFYIKIFKKPCNCLYKITIKNRRCITLHKSSYYTVGMYLSTQQCLGKIQSLISSKIWENKQLHLRDAEISKAEE